jgi:hypothetical protein
MVAQTGTARGSHARVDGSPAEARTWGSVGTHCPVAGLRAPGHCVHSSHTELRPGLAFWRRVELLKGVVRAAVVAAHSWERRRTLVTSLSCRAGLPQAAGAEAGIQQGLGGCPWALVTALS